MHHKTQSTTVTRGWFFQPFQNFVIFHPDFLKWEQPFLKNRNRPYHGGNGRPERKLEAIEKNYKTSQSKFAFGICSDKSVLLLSNPAVYIDLSVIFFLCPWTNWKRFQTLTERDKENALRFLRSCEWTAFGFWNTFQKLSLSVNVFFSMNALQKKAKCGNPKHYQDWKIHLNSQK